MTAAVTKATPRGDGEQREEHVDLLHLEAGPDLFYPADDLLHVLRQSLVVFVGDDILRHKVGTDADTGDIVWRERLGGVFAASPVAAGGHVYLTSEAGETIGLAAGREPTVGARNRLDERTLAAPAIADTRILIRTDQHLFCIEEPP